VDLSVILGLFEYLNSAAFQEQKNTGQSALSLSADKVRVDQEFGVYELGGSF
jgi:hypothetical protein